jgi:hypothetical protein
MEIQHAPSMQELAGVKAQADLDAIPSQGNAAQGIEGDDDTEACEKYPQEVAQIMQ